MNPSQLLVIFAIISVGVISERRKILNAVHIEGLEIFLFKISMPCYLFSSILGHDLSVLINAEYIYGYLLCFIIIASVVAAIFYKQDGISAISMKILAAGYVNAAIYTLPIITLLLGDPIAGVLGNLIQVIVIQTLFVTLLSLINHKEKSMPSRLLTAFSTPLVAMPIVALVCNFLKINLHEIITSIIASLGMGASGIALFAFGLTLGSIKIRKDTLNKDLIIIVGVKNILHPVLAFVIGKYIFHLDAYWLFSLLIAASAPTAFLVYLTAKQFAIQTNLVKGVIAISSIVSLFSLAIIACVIFSMELGLK